MTPATNALYAGIPGRVAFVDDGWEGDPLSAAAPLEALARRLHRELAGGRVTA